MDFSFLKSEPVAIPYQEPTVPRDALEKARRELLLTTGVVGVGSTMEGLVVYVDSREAVARLPSTIAGLSVHTEVTGPIHLL